MNLEFEVKGQILTRIDSHNVVNKNKNVYKCQFTFGEDDEWSDLNKFVIFKDGWGNSTTVHLGKEGTQLSCLIPEKVLRGSYFQVSVYSGDLITTNSVSIALIHSGYNHQKQHHPPHPPHPLPYPHLHHPPRPHHHRNDCHGDDGDVFVQIFDRLDNSVDSIVYDNNTLHLFSGDNILESVYLPFIPEEEFDGLVEDLVARFIFSNFIGEDESFLSSEDKAKLDSVEFGANRVVVDTEWSDVSDNPISNRVVKEALDGKEDSYDMVERLDNIIVDLINNGE